MEPGSSLKRQLAIVIVGAITIFALTPALAGARITVPPGATEGDQYFEEAPNGGGSASVDRSGGGGGGAPVAGTQALSSLGPEGRAAADLANANRPPGPGGPKQGATPQTSSSTEGEGGMGALFTILIAVTALGAIAYGLRRPLTQA